jgi:16S rRNA processing protein RimM
MHKLPYHLENEMKLAGWVPCARVGKPHGLKGAFFLKTTDNRTTLENYPSMAFHHPQEGFVESKILKTYLSGGWLVISLEGLENRSQVEELYNTPLYIQNHHIIKAPDEFLVGELIGCSVVDKTGKSLGILMAVVSFGAQDNFEILPGPGKKTVLYPFLESLVTVHREKKQIEIEYIPELFEGE